MEEMRNITRRSLGSEEMMFFRKTMERIAVWVVGGPGVTSQKFQKKTLNFDGKTWWTLYQPRICPTTANNVISLVWATMIAEFIAGHEFDVSDFLSQELRDQVVGGDKYILANPCIITQLCLSVRVQELPGIDEMLEDTNTTNLGLI